jgi:DNA-binding response OmpR family regulator
VRGAPFALRAAMPRARILVVDDDRAMAEMLAEGLVDRGFDARAIASSREAAALLELGGIDVLVSDVRMPHLDGHALRALSLRGDPARPVILMSGYGSDDACLTKPFKVAELAARIEEALARRRAIEEA